ncbi:MAG: metallophosphoesterase [Anaerolineaceae bacterium]|nr:metallophosphoesterase [Anaerolineaceae bacterium]
MSNHNQFDQQIAAGLDGAFKNKNRIKQLHSIELANPDAPRYIIFSDQHRGARNGADDFQKSERAYNAALAYYNALGYHLVALGDVEELWEERESSVMAAYAHSLSLERAFHEDGRYHRAFGNHDEVWSQPETVRQLLQPAFGHNLLHVYEGFKLRIKREGRPLGQFFLVHGHQGTADSDKWAWLSKPLVRYLWRPLQRLTKYRRTTPATDWRLRKRHNVAMYRWARAAQERLVLITGHTHYPVFESKTHEEQLMEEMEAVLTDDTVTGDEKQTKIAGLAAKLEWVRAQQSQGQVAAAPDLADMRPCYFNTGCCSFSDGDITGLEIADSEIRLIKWPGDESAAGPHILARATLDAVFNRLQPASAPNKAAQNGRAPEHAAGEPLTAIA